MPKLEQPIRLVELASLAEKTPNHQKINGLDLVVIRYQQEKVSVLYGRCLHRGALMADGYVEGENIVCGVHHWDYRIDSGVSSYNNKECLYKFNSQIQKGWIYVDEQQINDYLQKHPHRFNEDEYQGWYKDTHPEATEPYTEIINELATNGLKNIGHHGPTSAMGVDRNTLPKWDDLQYLPAQLWKRPLDDNAAVDSSTIIGKNAQKPLKLAIPLFISDMSFGALSLEAKVSLSKGAQLTGTGICSGEGGVLPQEAQENERYFYELASGQFGFSWEMIKKVQAFHFKGGQGAKTGVGGHLPANKVKGDIARVRQVPEGVTVISPASFTKMKNPQDFANFSQKVREISGGIPIGFKIAASHIEKDIDFALAATADYIILDGRGGATGAAPDILRNHINVPTIVALARARNHLDSLKSSLTLVITGGLRVAEDFAKAMMLGADAIAISNSALQAIGCLGMRACHTNNCPVGIATQKEHLRRRLVVDVAAQRLSNYLLATTELMKVIARACGHDSFRKFNREDLTAFKREMADLTGIPYAGVRSPL